MTGTPADDTPINNESGPDSRLVQASAYLNADRADDAARLAGQVVAEHPGDPEAVRVLAAALLETKRKDQALAMCREAVRLAPEDHVAWRLLGTALSAMGRPNEAIDAVARALELEPNGPVEHMVMSECLGRSGRARDRRGSLLHARAAVELAPDLPAAHVTAGNAYLRMNQRSRARAAYETALRIDPADSTARHNLGTLKASQGQFLDAADTFAGVLRDDPTDEQTRRHFAAAVSGAGRTAAIIGMVGVAAAVRARILTESDSLAADPTTGWYRIVPTVIMVLALIVVAIRVAMLWRSNTRVATLMAQDKLIIGWLALTFAYLIAGIVVFALGLGTGIIIAVLLPPYLVSAVLMYVSSRRLKRLWA